ncbi:DUF4136 domain-containing protein [Fulvivirgaceae bacterium PWU5]|uniref:DUF4136 domain-containing protein n=1 Tax=Dawidia cretensis TaxID=2782350 RepID=A0AAP2E262_9BACT|nr:DUF4136 domain-containing protein [Dawidia cretensis]MBT1710643.1 DUF4136 domain-containing protein [Dawidia cretensis]
MKRYLFVLAVIPALWSCEPEPDNLRLLDQLVVSTNFDPDTEFQSFDTYTIPTDTIGYVSNTSRDTIWTYTAAQPYPRRMIQTVREQMDSIGLTYVGRDQDPDVGMNIYIIENLNLFQQVYYPNYYSNYYGYGGYYYYPIVQTYAQNTATLVVEMIDLKNRNANNQVKIVWNAYMGDVVNSVNYEQQSIDAIRTAVRQSPYLH